MPQFDFVELKILAGSKLFVMHLSTNLGEISHPRQMLSLILVLLICKQPHGIVYVCPSLMGERPGLLLNAGVILEAVFLMLHL